MGDLLDLSATIHEIALVLDPLPRRDGIRVMAASCIMVGEYDDADRFLAILRHGEQMGKALAAWGEAIQISTAQSSGGEAKSSDSDG